jgi:hypothetical protein
VCIYVTFFLPHGATALGEPWPPQQPVSIALCLSSSQSIALYIYVTYFGQTLTTNPVKNVKKIFYLHDSSAEMYIILVLFWSFQKL